LSRGGDGGGGGGGGGAGSGSGSGGSPQDLPPFDLGEPGPLEEINGFDGFLRDMMEGGDDEPVDGPVDGPGGPGGESVNLRGDGGGGGAAPSPSTLAPFALTVGLLGRRSRDVADR